MLSSVNSPDWLVSTAAPLHTCVSTRAAGDVSSGPRSKLMRRSIARPGQPPRNRGVRHALFCSKLQRRLARHDDLDCRFRAGFGFQIDPAAQTIGHDVVDDVQSEASAALVAPGCEKRVEHLALDLRAHSAAIV